jgi:hypothetical protein
MRTAAPLLTSFIFSLAILGCGLHDADLDESELASAEFEVATIPTGVRCIHVKAIGGTTVSRNFSVSAGTTVTLALGRVPLGDVRFEGFAYDIACPNNSSPPSGQPSWVADAVAMEVFAGAEIVVPFVFRRYGNGTGTVDFVEPVVDISAGATRTVAAMLDGSVREWGLGRPAVPTPVAGLDDVVAVGAGAAHWCALRDDRTLWCWGHNSSGQLGDGTTTGRDTPAPVVGLSDVVDFSVGGHHTCAVKNDGGLYCWGNNANMQVGDGTTTARTTPRKIGEGFWTGAVQVAAGSHHTCAAIDLGQVYCWGTNALGQLGTGTTGGNAAVSSPVANLHAVVQVAAGMHQSCGLRADGTALCWGSGRPTAGLVSGLTDAVQIDAGGQHTCATLADGAARCWGRNDRGQLGNGDGQSSELPVAVRSLNDTMTVSGGDWHTCAVGKNGAATCWGSNVDGQLGDGTTIARFVPVAVSL